jgi:uncharacterized protein (TIGR02271 family)
MIRPGDGEEQVVPVIEEELVTGSETVKTGSVRVKKEVQQTRKTVSMPAVRDVVKVSRIPVGRVIETMPQVREEGDIVVVPVVEEEIVVRKRLVLKEEIHIQRRRTRSEISKDVTLNKESASIERLDAEGRVINTPSKALGRRRSLFD